MTSENTVGARLDDTLGDEGFVESIQKIMIALGTPDKGNDADILSLREGILEAALLMDIALAAD